MQITRGELVINLLGEQKAAGDKFVDAVLINTDGEEVKLSDQLDGVTIISVIPDITTRTCEKQTIYLTKDARRNDYKLITISTNTPEQVKEWSQKHNLEVTALSDRDLAFGEAYGIVMEGQDKLARSVYVIDEDRVIQYVEIVPEMTNEPQYIQLLHAAQETQNK